MTIRIEVSRDKELWNAIVEKSPQGTIFHTWDWLKIAEKHTNAKLYPLIGFKGSEPIGAFPIFYNKKLLIKITYSPPAYVSIPYLGPIIANYNNLKEDKKLSYLTHLIKVVDDFIINELHSNYISIILPPNQLDCRPFKWLGYAISPAFHYLVNLSNGEEYIWSQIKRKLRSDIERTKKKGVYVEEGEKEDLIYIYNLLVQRYKDQNLSVNVSKNYLIDIYEKFSPENLKIFVAKHNDKILTGIVVLIYKNKATFWIGAPKKNFMGTSPNDLIQWEAIRWACRKNLKYYEEIGAGVERLAVFKSKYNPHLCVSFVVKKHGVTAKIAERLYLRFRKFGFRL